MLLVWDCGISVVSPYFAIVKKMTRRVMLVALFVLACTAVTTHADQKNIPQVKVAEAAKLPAVEAAFVPGDDIESILLSEFARANKQILVQAYLLTSVPLVSGLIEAHRRGVQVLVLVDGGQLGRRGRKQLARMDGAGLPIWLENKYKNAHNKLIVLDAGTDNATVITGSYNFTWSAQHTKAENILIIRRNIALAAQYAANWQKHRAEAQSYSQQR